MPEKKVRVIKLDQCQVDELCDRIKTDTLTPEDQELLVNVLTTLRFISGKLEEKNFQLKRLLKQLFGIKSEKTRNLEKQLNSETPAETIKPSSAEDGLATGSSLGIISDDKAKPDDTPPENSKKGHGHIGVGDYTGATTIFLSHATLKHGDPCPECLKGKVYVQKDPGVFIYISSRACLQAVVYRTEKLRCNLCCEIFQAGLPDQLKKIDQIPGRHFDETALSMLLILKYGAGFPMNRIADLQMLFGLPVPASTIWDQIKKCTGTFFPVFNALTENAAQGDIFFNDDTKMRILSTMKLIEEEKEKSKGKIRTGIFTTGIVVKYQEHTIVLYYSGRRHAGENISELLQKRSDDKPLPIQMCDAKNGNTPKDIDVIECNCNTHARRNFVEVAQDFPDQCRYVIVDVFGRIYENDAVAKEKKMSDQQRLEFHQANSGPIMQRFYNWINEQFENKDVEPNSKLGKAMTYILNHYEALTRFLEVPGAPLDNNICERALKKVILHRKNALFFKTEKGALIGDMFMSLIETCRINAINVFEYLTMLQTHRTLVLENPSNWLPWNFRKTLDLLEAKSPVLKAA